jgi:hypothetical protein
MNGPEHKAEAHDEVARRQVVLFAADHKGTRREVFAGGRRFGDLGQRRFNVVSSGFGLR